MHESLCFSIQSSSPNLDDLRAISDAVARSSIVFCNSHCNGCVKVASSCGCIRKSYWSGCMKAATVICQQIFSILALMIFLLKILLKNVSKSSFFVLWRRDPVLELQFPTPLRVVVLCFATLTLQIAL